MRKILLLALIILLSASLYAVGFGYHVLDVKSSPEFGKGVFPTAVEYQFNFPMPGETLLTFRLNNGLDFRTIQQDPESGKLLAEYGNVGKFADFSVRDYSAFFDEFNLLFAQGLFKTSLSNKSLITISAALGGRFELAFESLSWMTDSNHTEALFWSDTSGTARFDSFVGAPELKGDRNIMHTFLTFGFELDMLKDDIVKKNGLKLSSTFRLCPEWMPLNDGTGEYTLSSTTLSFAYTLFSIDQGNNSLSWFSMLFGNDTTYRYIKGSKVPYYIQGGDIFGERAANTESIITNSTYISLYGPQLKVKDLYPSITLFHDLALSFGKVLNMEEEEKIIEYTGVVGFRAEFNMYDICKLFYEAGIAYFEQFTHKSNNIKARFGFTLEI